MIQGRSLNKIPFDESFPNEQVNSHDTNQGEDYTSYGYKVTMLSSILI